MHTKQTVRIRLSDPLRLTCYIKRYIRKRKRAYRKAKPTNSSINWNKFKKLHDKVVSLIRESKQAHIDKISNKLKSDIVSKYNVGLKRLLQEGLSEPEFYGDLVYEFRKIIGKNDFPYHFKKIIVRYKKIGYNIDVLRQTACLVVNPIKVNSFAYLFNCTTVGRASD